MQRLKSLYIAMGSQLERIKRALTPHDRHGQQKYNETSAQNLVTKNTLVSSVCYTGQKKKSWQDFTTLKNLARKRAGTNASPFTRALTVDTLRHYYIL